MEKTTGSYDKNLDISECIVIVCRCGGDSESVPKGKCQKGNFCEFADWK